MKPTEIIRSANKFAEDQMALDCSKEYLLTSQGWVRSANGLVWDKTDALGQQYCCTIDRAIEREVEWATEAVALTQMESTGPGPQP